MSNMTKLLKCFVGAVIRAMLLQQGLVFSASALAVKDKTNTNTGVKTPSDMRNLHISRKSFQCKCVILIRVKSQMEKPYMSGRIDNNMEIFGSWGRLAQIQGEEGATTLWEYSSKFDSYSQLQQRAAFEFKLFLICQHRAFCHPSCTA